MNSKNRTEYNKLQTESKRSLREAIKRFEQENPERFKELQARAQYELEHPPERPIIRYTPSRIHFDADEFIRQHHTKDFYIYTEDCWGDSHLYFESLSHLYPLYGETPVEVLIRRHPKFTERQEKIVKVEPCVCPLCS